MTHGPQSAFARRSRLSEYHRKVSAKSVDRLIEQELVALTRAEVLRERVIGALHRRSDKPIVVGISFRGQSSWVATGSQSAAQRDPAPAVGPGCITKLLTATLVRQAALEGCFGLDDPAGELLQLRNGSVPETLSGIKVKHLLEHTHGLDDSRARELPRSAEGFIDSEAMCAQLCSGKALAEPGCVHSYGNAGPWIAAAILERIYERRYADLLSESLLLPFGMGVGPDNGAVTGCAPRSVCPAIGGSLRVSIDGLLRFLLAAPLPDPASGLDGVEGSCVTPLPGWSSQEHGIWLGWKHYGSGWFGHNSAVTAAAGLARVLPSERLAIVAASADHSLSNILARLFGNLLPALAGLKVPRPLNAEAATALDMEPFVGVYANNALSISVARSKPGTLRLQAFQTVGHPDASEPLLTAILRPACDNVFFTVPAHTDLFPFVQFVGNLPHGRRFLWNGRSVWPAIPGPRST